MTYQELGISKKWIIGETIIFALLMMSALMILTIKGRHEKIRPFHFCAQCEYISGEIIRERIK